MEKLFFTLAALILVSSCSGQYSSCDDYPCPKYDVVSSNQDFEERRYVDTDWITTRLSRQDASSLIDAAKTLKNFCDQQKQAGHQILDGWPAIITITTGGSSSASLSWFLAPGSNPEITDTSVTLEHKAGFTVYVRRYSGIPSLDEAEENRKILHEDLAKAGKKLDPNISIGAFYESVTSITHHNEIWAYST